jgi:hypothetical protein
VSGRRSRKRSSREVQACPDWVVHSFILKIQGKITLFTSTDLSHNAKEFKNKLGLNHTFQVSHSFSLSFANHTHGFIPSLRSSCDVERFEFLNKMLGT